MYQISDSLKNKNRKAADISNFRIAVACLLARQIKFLIFMSLFGRLLKLTTFPLRVQTFLYFWQQPLLFPDKQSL